MDPQTADPTEDREEWFLRCLEQAVFPTAEMMGALRAMLEADPGGNVDELCELFEDALAERGHGDSAIEALALRASWRETDPGFARSCRSRARALLESDRERRGMTDHVGFDENLPPAECLRRLTVLLSLVPERICYDKTWGFGVIERVDPFYKRVTIQFNKKRGHEMSFAYAAEALELIAEDHLLARNHFAPHPLRALIKENPSEVVRIALRSYGPLSVPALQQALVPDILPEADWKRFWDAARKELKQDPLVDVPAKRSEPIRLLDQAFAYDVDWFAALAKERRIDFLLREIDALIENEDVAGLSESAREILRDRLEFAVRGADGTDAGYMARALMQSGILQLDLKTVREDNSLVSFFREKRFLEAAAQLSARDLKALVEALVENAGEFAAERMAPLVPRLPLAALQEVLDALLRRGFEAKCAAILKGITDVKGASVDVLAWIARDPDRLAAWSLGTCAGFLNDILTALEEGVGGPVTRGRTQLARQFEDSAWLQRVLESMSPAQRRALLNRLRETPAFEEMDRRSVLGRIVKLYPDLQSELATRVAARGDERPSGRITSIRSFHERRNQLERIVKQDIPNNSKEIAVARSYGDLRENHEFKAAKEMQAILLRRQAELESMLLDVRPSDFTEFPKGAAGPGAGVRLQYEDGREETYVILGEWDRDEDLGIISSTTRMAQALEGACAGDTVKVPAEDGEATARIVEVTGLTDAVRAWMEETPGTAP